ncbi:acyl-CoA dehydrogenase family protein [Streptosporangium sp. NPDC002524]|uniref:acyl-CoA dehydrogenase family protein n=1 Tax=Streptosporangium sp. NPDC002524 TaxID=3154537 RepID=UPI00331C6DF9
MDQTIEAALGTAARLDRALGDPMDERNPASFRAAVTTDREGRFPQHLRDAAFSWGLGEYLTPAASGGRLRSLDHCLALFRVLARRDLTAASVIAAGFLAGLPVWQRGTPAQRQAVAALLRRHELLGLPLGETEQGADGSDGMDGADVIAAPRTDSLAESLAGAGPGWSLSGRTTLVGHDGHAAGTTLLARTGTGVTAFLLLREADRGGHWRSDPAYETHGLRGSALGRLTLSGFPAGPAEMVGPPGEGLETTARTLPVARLVVAGLALGGLDTCLRAVVAFTRSRRLYGAPILELEPVAVRLTDVYADLLIGEAVCHELCRVARTDPHRFPAASARVGDLVPELAGDGVESLAIVLGARAYCSTEHWHGIVEKMRRDVAVVTALSDFGDLPPAAPPDELPPDPFVLVPPELAWLGEHVPEGADDGDTLARVRALVREEGLPGPYAPRLLELLDRLAEIAPPGDAHLDAAAACASAWLRGRHRDDFHATGAWLLLCLRRIAVRLGDPQPADTGPRRRAMDRVELDHDERRLFSDIEVPLR